MTGKKFSRKHMKDVNIRKRSPLFACRLTKKPDQGPSNAEVIFYDPGKRLQKI